MVMITEKDINRKFINREGKICTITGFDFEYKDCPVTYTDGISIGRLPVHGKISDMGIPHAWDFTGWLYEK